MLVVGDAVANPTPVDMLPSAKVGDEVGEAVKEPCPMDILIPPPSGSSLTLFEDEDLELLEEDLEPFEDDDLLPLELFLEHLEPLW